MNFSVKVKVVDTKTNKVNEYWTSRLNRKLSNDEYVQIPSNMKLSISGHK